MADEPEAPGTKMSLDEIFAKAGLGPKVEYQEGVVALRSLRRELQCLRFAHLYVQHHFDASKAYAQFNPRCPPGKVKVRAMRWMMGKGSGARVSFHIRQILQEATAKAEASGLLDVQQLINMNQVLIMADATELVEQARGQDGKVYTRFKPVHVLTPEQRLAVRTIKLRNGEVIQMETYSRLEAQKSQLELLEQLSAKGGNNQSWMGQFNKRIEAARTRRLQYEKDTANGTNVVKLTQR